MKLKNCLANRALGIMYNFIYNNFLHLDTWLVPATICFSVPLLIVKLNKKIEFYDYDSPVDFIIEKLKTQSKGLILTNYYGSTTWKEEDISILKNYTECLILDSCLSIPTEVVVTVADLVLFTTGKSKVIDLGYGAIGFYQPNYLLSFPKQSEKKLIDYNYESLDKKWKDSLNNKTKFSDSLVHSDWIDYYDDLINPIIYKQKLETIKDKTLIHKKKLNSIYSKIIPAELIPSNLSNIWRFNIFVNNKELLLSHIFEKGLFASSHYANCECVIMGNSNLQNSNFIEKNIINLFNDFNFNESMAEACAYIVKNLFNQKKIQPAFSKNFS